MWSINKDVPLPRMRMNIQEHLELVSLLRDLLGEVFLHKLPYMLHFSQPHLCLGIIVSKKAPVHILALSVAPVVT